MPTICTNLRMNYVWCFSEPVVSPGGLSVVSADSGLSGQPTATVIVPSTSNSSEVSSGVAVAELSPPPSSRQSDSGHATLSASPTQTVNLNVQTVSNKKN